MTSSGLDIVAIGDAIVDVIAAADDRFLEARGLAKGSMRLLNWDEANLLYAAMGPAREISGGSAANSLSGAASLGLRTAFIGQVADDQLGTIFAHDLRSLGIRFETPAIGSPPPTGRCLILVTPDAQRTMSTFPGASHELTADAIDPSLIQSASVTFLEGYLWGAEGPRAAMLEAAAIARSATRTVAFTLSESLLIGDRRDGVMRMIEAKTLDVLFGNEHEIRHLTGCEDLAESITVLSGHVQILVVTRGAKGAIAIEDGKKKEIPAPRVARVIDTTGAGDHFAAGFLAARCRGRDLSDCLAAGSIAAGEAISHYGARPETNLKELTGL